MTNPKIHISRAIWDEDTREVAYIVDGFMFADVATQRKLNAVDDMYEALEQMEPLINNSTGIVGYYMNGNVAKWNDFDVTRIIGNALRKARGEAE